MREDQMPERSNEEIVRRYWRAHAAHDHKTVSELRHPDWLAEWPQSRERVRGDANDRAIMDNYPGGEPHLDATHRIVGAEDRWVVTPAYTVQRVIGNGDAWWGSGIGTYPDGKVWHFVAMVELRDGKIYRETAYFAEPFDPPEWRAAWVETMD
jgi:hypothetical protein